MNEISLKMRSGHFVAEQCSLIKPLKEKIRREVLQCSDPEFLRKVKARTEMKVGHSERTVQFIF